MLLRDGPALVTGVGQGNGLAIAKRRAIHGACGLAPGIKETAVKEVADDVAWACWMASSSMIDVEEAQ